MNRTFKPTLLGLSILVLAMSHCTQTEKKQAEAKEQKPITVLYDTNDPKSRILTVAEACGGIERLKALKDVEFDYHYLKPNGKKDISKERYIFDKEISWAKYSIHEDMVSPNLEGDIVQFYDGETYEVYNQGNKLSNAHDISVGQFSRQTNFMWFTMMFKLTDPGTVYEYLGKKEVEGTNYDLLKVTYDPVITEKEHNDTYILYINPDSKMVELFKFSIEEFGINNPIILSKVTYTDMSGIKVISRREMFAPSPEGKGMIPFVDQHIKNVKFNNGFTIENLRREISSD